MVIKLRPYIYLEENQLLPSTQLDFRKGLGIEDAIVNLASNVLQTLDSRQKSQVIYMDLSKVFDSGLKHKLIKHLNLKL